MKGLCLGGSFLVFLEVIPDESKGNKHDDGDTFPGVLFIPYALIDCPKAAKRRDKAVDYEKRKKDTVFHEGRGFKPHC